MFHDERNPVYVIQKRILFSSHLALEGTWYTVFDDERNPVYVISQRSGGCASGPCFDIKIESCDRCPTNSWRFKGESTLEISTSPLYKSSDGWWQARGLQSAGLTIYMRLKKLNWNGLGDMELVWRSSSENQQGVGWKVSEEF